MAEPKDMFQCQVSNCGYIFDPDKGVKKQKLLQVPLSKIFRTTGCVQVAALPQKHSDHLLGQVL